MFYIIHLCTVDTNLEIILYSCCIVVQALKIYNFFGEKERKYLRPFAWLGMIFSAALMSLFVMHIVCLIRFPAKSVLAWLQIVSLYWSTIVMLPLIHFMVLRQQSLSEDEKATAFDSVLSLNGTPRGGSGYYPPERPNQL